MEIEIVRISKELIKPSSPTPKDLSKYQLSFLDQIAPPVLMPLIYFYPANHDTNTNIPNSEKSNHLKKSLSQVLSIFYPLAGRFVDDIYIVECNDQGVPFIEAEANCNLSDVLTDPLIPKDMSKFLPYKLDDVRDLCVAVQVTFFKCGGLAIAIPFLHKVGDALADIQFINTWAAMARNGNTDDVPKPIFGGTMKDFPPRDLEGFKRGPGTLKDQVSKIFTFPAEKITVLQERYSNGRDRRPSRVEALSTFMWTRLMSATESTKDGSENKVYTVVQPVNLRTRLEPPLSNNHFGNIVLASIATATLEDARVVDGHCELLQKLRGAIRGVNGDHVAHLKEPGVHLKSLKDRMARGDRGEVVAFTSLCRFPLYEADFGWGKPSRISSAEYRGNMVVFMDTAKGDGIEAWAHLKKEAIEKFEADLELQEFLC